MKIIEVRDGFIKLAADENVYLSSFVKAAGTEKDYIAQISSLKKVNDITVAYAKILFIMRDEALYNYDNTEPTVDSELTPFTLDILNNSINPEKPVIIGKTQGASGNIIIDLSAFNKKMLISVDDVNLNNLLVSNLTKQFDNVGLNTLIIDTCKIVKGNKYSAGKDFKLPLNKITLQYLRQTCLNEATQDSKQMITEVFNDISEYFETVPFVPFGLLKSIVDDMVDKQHVFKLFVLKNKLSFLSKLGYFAENTSEAESFKKIIESKNPIIDITNINAEFQNYYIEYIYSQLQSEKTQVLLETSNIVSKRNLKLIIKESEISTTLIVHSKYRYLNDIKAMFDNFIIEPTFDNKSVFRVYNSFLSSMSENTYLITGEGINYIPMISNAVVIDDVISPQEPEIEVLSQESVQYDENTPVDNQINDIQIDNSQNDADIVPEDDEQENLDEEILEEEAQTDDIQEPEESLSNEEIVSSIDQKSEQIIDSLSENTEDIQNIDLFTDDDEEESLAEEIAEESEEIIDENVEQDIISDNDNSFQEDIIEPEYQELPADTEESEDYTQINTEDTEEELQDNIVSEDEIMIPDDENIQENNLTLQEESDEVVDIGDVGQELLDTDLLEINEQLPEFDNSEDSDIQEEPIAEYNGDMEELSSGMDDLSSEEIVQESTEEIVDNSELSVEDFSSDDDVIGDLEELVELNPEEADENDIVIDISDEDENINIDEDTDKQIVEDVDKVYTTIKEPDEEYDISDSDLDLIDELNSDEEEAPEEFTGLEEGMLEQPSDSIIPEKTVEDNQEILEKKASDTPIVPVYDADIPQEDVVVSDPIQQGDAVVHAKYGNGVVEKMMKYGSKTLVSINFENIGRRLLDPTLMEIKKL